MSKVIAICDVYAGVDGNGKDVTGCVLVDSVRRLLLPLARVEIGGSVRKRVMRVHVREKREDGSARRPDVKRQNTPRLHPDHTSKAVELSSCGLPVVRFSDPMWRP